MNFSKYLKFEINHDNLILFRIVFGAILSIKFFSLTAAAEVFYSDNGLTPWELVKAVSKTTNFPNLFDISGSLYFSTFLFIFGIILSGLFALGFKTKSCALALLFLIYSTVTRNPFVTNSSDFIIIQILTFYIIVPNGSAKRKIYDFGLLLQIFYIYFFSGLKKLDSITWNQGEALMYISESFTVLNQLGLYVFRNIPTDLFKILDWLVIFIEILVPFFIFTPDRTRKIFFCIFLVFHLSVAAFFQLGLFSYVMIAVLALFCPWSSAIVAYIRRFFSNSEVSDGTLTPVRSMKIENLKLGIMVLLLLNGLVVNILSLNDFAFLKQYSTIQKVYQINLNFNTFQNWRMFNEMAFRKSNYIRLTSQNSSGQTYSLLEKDMVNLNELPTTSSYQFPSDYWRKYFKNKIFYSPLSQPYVKNYFCRKKAERFGQIIEIYAYSDSRMSRELGSIKRKALNPIICELSD